MQMKGKTKVSVILPAFGHCPHLMDVIAAITVGELQPDEIIVSHSGADDPSEAILARFPGLTMLHQEARLYAGEARNRGAAAATGEVLAFCDSDTRPGQTWLSELVGVLASAQRRFVVGAVGIARRGGYWGMSNWLLEFSEQAPWRPPGAQTGGASCNMALLAKDFLAVGGFRGDLRGGEDTTLFSDLRRLGLEQIFQPKAVVHHFNNSGFAAFARHQAGLGASFADVRRERDMPGSFFVRHPPLPLLLCLPKAMLVLRRTFICGLTPGFTALYLAPGVILGSVIWSISCLKRATSLKRGLVANG